MAIVDTIGAAAEPGLAAEFAAMAERLRRSTVQVRGRGPGGGSGVIWRPNGLIITNAHVARGSEAIVELWDGRVLEGNVTARDQRRDLAAIQLTATELPTAAIGDSAELRVGELVLAVGNPLGLVGALTTGIVHAVTPVEGRRGQHWVQADVRLAPGNSGGPLANARGQVIGINSMINGGLALAVPSNDVERFIRRGAEQPYLGITTQPVQVRLEGRRALGLLVLETAPGGAAEAAGLLTGDVLIGVAGRPFSAPEDLLDALHDAGPGSALSLNVIRAATHLVREVIVARREPAQAEAA